MTQIDLIRIATQLRVAHIEKRPFRTPAMSVRDSARLSQLLVVEAGPTRAAA